VIHDSVRAVVGLETGSIDVVALPTLAADPLAAIVGAFRRAYPGVMVRITEPESADEVAERVWDGRAEVGLAELPVTRDEVVAVPLLDQELVAVLPPGAKPGDITVEELATFPLVATPVGTSTRRLLTDAFSAAALTPRIAVETEQREAIVPLVLAGAGAALLPRPQAATAAAHGATISALKPALRRTIGLVHRVGALSPAAARFCDTARDIATLAESADPTLEHHQHP
jgi:DNA-binding transcriptional LysR family regulator